MNAKNAADGIEAQLQKLTLRRLEQLVFRVSVSPQQETIAGAVDVIVYLRRRGTGRVVEEILGIDGYDGETRRYMVHEIN